MKLKYHYPNLDTLARYHLVDSSRVNTRDQNADAAQKRKHAASPSGYCINDITGTQTPKEPHYTHLYIHVYIYLLHHLPTFFWV